VRLDQLLSFKCVADERSYTRAGEKRFLTQPAIYGQIRQLEAECGAKLFYVSGKEVLLTAEGQDLYSLAQRVAAADEDYQKRVSQRAEQRAHHVRIGALSYFGILSDATERLRIESPLISVDFHSRRPAEAMAMLRAREIDFGCFGPAYQMEGFVFEQCAVNRIAVLAPAGHELIGREVEFDELAAFPVVGYAGGSARMAVDEWLSREPGRSIDYAAQTDSSMAAKSLALSLGTPAFIVRQAAADDLAAGTLVELNVRGFDAAYPLYLIYLEEAQLGAGAAHYLAIARELFRMASPATSL